MKIPLSTRLWLAWRVIRGQLTSVAFSSDDRGSVTELRFSGNLDGRLRP